ncbi:E3 ubiquitin/ISG15 ligase TRIM25 [Lissotriton helveticus]
MAEMSGSLLDLSEEFTCSICLGTFESPVTTPCGHNFCRVCLEVIWATEAQEGWKCPQCRTGFATKPELRKNTVLDTVVQQYLLDVNRCEQEQQEQQAQPEPEEEEESCPDGAVPCDSCLKVAAVRTCLTCIASFCQEHLQPHLGSQAFAHHQLHSPLGSSELGLRTCKDHKKLLEYFCEEHGKCLCCYCLVDHKACKTHTVPEAKLKREENLRCRNSTLFDKIENISSAFDELTSQEFKVKDTLEKKKALLVEEFSEMKTIIQLEEQKVMKIVDDELKRVLNKFSYTQNALHKKKKEFENVKEKVESLLIEDDDIIFLMKATKLNDTTTKDAFVPRIDCDHKLLHTICRDVYYLKEKLRNHKSPNDQTDDMKNEESFGSASPNKEQVYVKNKEDGRSASMPPPPLFKKIPKQNPPGGRNKSATRHPETKKEPESDPKCTPDQRSREPKPRRPAKGNPSHAAPLSFSTNRDELLNFAEKLSLDFNTAHKRIVLTERNTKMSVTDTPLHYSDNPQRFTHCSQVLGFQGFSRGIHYWEVEIKSSNFCGIGVSYKSIDRRGTESRLGRNKVSWCIEWFNAKLSAWHNDVEEILHNPSPDRVGVLLNCDNGQVSFFSHASKTILLYKFQAQFTEAVFPAFWVFSSNTTLALCPLK